MVGLIEPKNVNSLDFIVSTSKMTIADQGEALREISSFRTALFWSPLALATDFFDVPMSLRTS